MSSKLDLSDISLMTIAFASGATKASIAKVLSVHPSTVTYNLEKHKCRLDVFNEFDGVVSLTDRSKVLDINGVLVVKNIEITGNPSDGVIICDHVYGTDDQGDTDSDNVVLVQLEMNDITDWMFEDNEMGAVKPFKVGVLMIRDAYMETANTTFSKVPYSGDEGTIFTLSPVVDQAVEPKVELVKEPEPIWNASNRFISITVGRETKNAGPGHPNFKQALQKLVDGDVMGALDLINTERAIKRFVKGNVTIENGQLFYKGIELKSGLTKRIIDSMGNGKDFEFFLPFLENLMLNPSNKAITRLFDFLEANDIEITADGQFIAWKKVAHDFMDLRTRTIDNSPGKTPTMPRNMVNENDLETCSHGLHVCSQSYLSQYGTGPGSRTVKVKVHPKDVVSIPVDYGNAKMRTCAYHVLEALPQAV